MLHRRKFLLMVLLSAIAPTLHGCQGSNNSLTIKVLKDSIPPQLLGDFQDTFELKRKVNVKPISQLKSLYQLLEKSATEEEKKGADLITLGDIWLKNAITEGLIQPLPVTSLTNWQLLPSSWQALVKRDVQGNPDPTGNIWGAPYRWGSTVIAYREDKFSQAGYDPPTDWHDFWREELRDRISLLNHPREVIGFTLKKLGYSYNVSDLDKIPNLRAELTSLHQQVKFYSSQAYLQPLVLGDTWLAVGWSHDFLQLRTRYPDIKTIIPQSGTALWADLWVQPTRSPSLSEELLNWINFCWQPEAATQIGLFTNASSPIFLSQNQLNTPKTLQEDNIRIPSSDLLEESEFLLPLSANTERQYQNLWQTISN